MVYPPPTLVRKPASRAVWIRRLVLLGTLLLLGATWAISNLLSSRKDQPLIAGSQGRLPETTTDPAGSTETALGPIDGNAGAPPPPAVADAAAPAPASAPAPEPATAAPPQQQAAAAPPAPEPAAPVQRAKDSRQADHWYYVRRLGDGPAVIFSRNGGSWDYALSCDRQRAKIEFIAVHTGDPQGFGGQYLRAGSIKATLDATYARTAGGTISMVLPARNPLFDALSSEGQVLEAQVVAGAPVTLPVNREVGRLVRQCRGQGA